MQDTFNYLEKNTDRTKTTSMIIIWLHGFGGDETDLLFFHESLRLLNLNINIKNIFLRSNKINASILNNTLVNAWYDIYDFTNITQKEDKNGIKNITKKIIDFINYIKKSSNINKEKIIIVGFSQGAAIAVNTLLNIGNIGGLISISGYLLNNDQIELDNFEESSKKTPIMICHGTGDSIIPISCSENMEKILTKKNFSVKLYPYICGHEIVEYEINEIVLWIKNIATKNIQ